MRILTVLLGGALIALALVIYEVKYETRALEARAAELRAAVQEERDAIAVLRAEWSLLNRPDRIERLARKHLGLEPVTANRMMTAEQFRTRLGESGAPSQGEPMAGPRERARPAILAH